MAKEMGAEELRLTVQRLARRIRAERAGDGISDAQLGALFTLEKNQPTTPGRLAELERVSPPSINRTLNALEERGWITRSPDPADLRRVVIGLTDAGAALIRETRRLRSAWFTRRLAELSAEERAVLEAAAPVLRHLAEADS